MCKVSFNYIELHNCLFVTVMKFVLYSALKTISHGGHPGGHERPKFFFSEIFSLSNLRFNEVLISSKNYLVSRGHQVLTALA